MIDGKRRAPSSARARPRARCAAGLYPFVLHSEQLRALTFEQRATARRSLTMWVTKCTSIEYIKVHLNREGDTWSVLRGQDTRLAPASRVGDQVVSDVYRGSRADLGGVVYDEILCIREFDHDEMIKMVLMFSDWQYAGSNELVPVVAARYEREVRALRQPCEDLLDDRQSLNSDIWLVNTGEIEAARIDFESESLYSQGWRISDERDGGTRVRDDLDLFVKRVDEKGNADDPTNGWDVLTIPHIHSPEMVRKILTSLSVPSNIARVDSGGNVHALRFRLRESEEKKIRKALLTY